MLASCLKSAVGYPRISVTVPSIVIMVPGLYFYRAIYNLGILSLMDSATWFADAILIIVALPLGLIFARIVTDNEFFGSNEMFSMSHKSRSLYSTTCHGSQF